VQTPAPDAQQTAPTATGWIRAISAPTTRRNSNKQNASDSFALETSLPTQAQLYFAAAPKKLYGAHFCLHSARANPDTPDAPQHIEFAFVVAKKLAKQASRRNLIRRIWRETLRAEAAQAPFQQTYMLVRLAKPYDPALYKSAQSRELRIAVASEARQLILQLRAQ
jgi:ribonuclease P protein component